VSTSPQRIGIIGSVPIYESPPGAPVLLSVVAGVSNMTLTWQAPSTGGSPLTSFTVLRSTNPGGETSYVTGISPSATTYVDTGVSGGLTYYYKVEAVNAIGTSPASNELSGILPTVPSAPVLTTATPGNGQVSLSWTIPASGGSPLTSFTILRGTSPGTESSYVSGIAPTVSNYIDTAATNGTTYYYKIEALNLVGTSSPSNELSATPGSGVTVPQAPTLVSAVPASAHVTLNWTPNGNGGSALTSYTVLRGTVSGSETVLASGLNPGLQAYTDSAIVDGTTYFYTVKAVNVVGSSFASNELSATPAAVPPSAPTLVATFGNATVGLTWTAAAPNGSPVTSYVVLRGPTATSMTDLVVLGNVLTYTDNAVTNGTAYFYAVAAVNGAGQGGTSNIETGTPTAPSQTAPPPVTNLQATVSGSSVITTWTNNGSSATHNETDGQDYFVDGVKVGFGGYPNPAPTTYTFTGLSNGTHTLGVSPYNGATVTEGVPITTVQVTISAPVGAALLGFYADGGLSGTESLASTLGVTLQGFSTYCNGSNGWSGLGAYSPPTLPTGCQLWLGVNMVPDNTALTQIPANIQQFKNIAGRLPNGTICRVGWEFDIGTGTGGPSSGPANVSQFVTYSQQIITAMKSINSTLKFDFSCNTGTSTTAQLLAYYGGSAGDAYWDYIGGDHYNNNGGTASNTFSAFTAAVNLASQRNKPVSIGEWGLNHGDSPTFISDAAQFILAPTAAASRYGWPAYTVAYQSYFSAASYGSNIAGGSYPNSEAQYKTSFG
jgi:fibronectin type 3 domain-containing protein